MDFENSVQMLQEMLEIYSPSGKEREMALYLKDKLVEVGFESVRTDDAGNVYGEVGSGSPSILLCGHMDTVVGLIPVKRKDNWLYGRGSVDAKSSLAAMIIASSNLKSNIKDGRLIVASVVEEERSSKGIRQLLRENINVDYAIFGEPSGLNNITFAYKGRVTTRIKCQTVSGHVGASHLLDNAIEKTFELWNNIKVECKKEGEDKEFFSIITPCLVGIHSRRTCGGVPDVCLIDIDLRLPPSVNTEAGIKIIKKAIEKFRIYNSKTSIAFLVIDKVEPFVAEKGTILMKALGRAIVETTGGTFRFLKKTGTGDMNIFGSEVKVPVATYGPGDSRLSHTKKERINLTEFQASIQVYQKAIKHLITWHKQVEE